jgi:hypothetical protein
MPDVELPNCDAARLYAINHQGVCGFFTGLNPAAEQVLMGVLDNQLLVAFFFSATGEYLRYELRPVLEKPDPNTGVAERVQWGRILQRTKSTFAEELGLSPGNICIRHFAFPEWGIGIAEWPWGTFEEVRIALEATGKLPDDDFVHEWKHNKRWVLNWKKEFWMNADGEVGDT